MPYTTIASDLDPRGVLTIRLNRPEVRNAFNEVVIQELFDCFSALPKETRVVVLRGEGPVFSAGGDLNWMKKALGADHAENLRDTKKLAEMFALLNECPRPVIAAVHGAAIGGGVGLVSVCDLVIATADTQFSLSEVRLGLVPACIGPFVVAKIGASRSRALFITGKRILADEACAIGLVHEVAQDSRDLAVRLEAAIDSILAAGPEAVATAKRLVLDLSWPEKRAQHPDCLDYVAQTLANVRVSPEAQEGTRAFLEKRKPSWAPGAQSAQRAKTS